MLARPILIAALLALVNVYTADRARSQTLGSEEEHVKRIQYLLLWAGNYARPIDGRLDPVLLQSIRDFQAKSGRSPTGTLDSNEIRTLAEVAARTMAQNDYAYLSDVSSGAHIALPRKILTERTNAGRGVRYAAPGQSIVVETVRYAGSDVSLVRLYKSYWETLSQDSVLENIFRGDRFILAWTTAGTTQIVQFDSDENELKGLTIRFDKETDPDFLPIAYAMTNDFAPLDKKTSPTYLSMPEMTRFPPASDQSRAPAKSPPTSSGTGFVVSMQGFVLTNAHVIQTCTHIMVGKDKSARLVALDALNDLALLQVPRLEAARTATFALEPVQLGTEIAAFGYPLRGILADQLNMTTGVVSALAGPAGNVKFIQISAAVQPGNSGGPLVDLTGRIVGIVTARLTRIRGANSLGETDIAQLVNFAIRHDRAATFLRQHGVEPQIAPPAAPKIMTELAREVAAYTVPITCFRQ